MHDHIAIASRINTKAALWTAFIAGRPAVGMAIGLGVVFGLVVHLVNFYDMTTIFQRFCMARDSVAIFAYSVYYAVLGLVYSCPAEAIMAELTEHLFPLT